MSYFPSLETRAGTRVEEVRDVQTIGSGHHISVPKRPYKFSAVVHGAAEAGVGIIRMRFVHIHFLSPGFRR